MDEKEAAQRCATASRFTVDDWHPVVHEWWAAGHSLEGLVEWVERDGVVPGIVSASLTFVNSGREAAVSFEEAMANVTEAMQNSTVSLDDLAWWPDGDPLEPGR